MANISWEDVPLLEWAAEHERETVDLIRQMVELESPSDDHVALKQFADWFAEMVIRRFGALVDTAPCGHLLCQFKTNQLQGNRSQVLVLGHYDTVWPINTIKKMPFREASGRLWGPGVLDMKGGIGLLLMAIEALRGLGVPLRSNVLLQLNADEEIGSQTSRELTQSNAKSSSAVLVIEPGTGLSGKLKTSRKGVGAYTIKVEGRASHAGVDFEAGASAILELSRQLLTIAEFTDLEEGTTVNPGVISGGTRGNVIAAEAQAIVDVRVARASDGFALDKKFRALKPFDTRCSLAVNGGLNRPPMERSEGIAALFEVAQRCARELGMEIEESATGGGSDGNFTAALGVPTLDGVGAVGEGAHASHESILVSRIADRTALLAMLLATL